MACAMHCFQASLFNGGLMQTPLRITWRHVAPSDVLEARIREEAARLEDFFGRIISCHVTVDVPHLHHRHGHHYRVGIELQVPHETLVVGRDPALHDNTQDAYAAVNEAFQEATRRLQDYTRKARWDVKHHEPTPRARVARLDRERGFGTLETPDGREIYFHQNSVLNGAFHRLDVGAEVRFAEELGEKGPQASTVAL